MTRFIEVMLETAECQINPDHKGMDDIVDGRIAGTSTWGWMCVGCHAHYGVGLGTGRGQLFRRLRPGSPIFYKVDG